MTSFGRRVAVVVASAAVAVSGGLLAASPASAAPVATPCAAQYQQYKDDVAKENAWYAEYQHSSGQKKKKAHAEYLQWQAKADSAYRDYERCKASHF